MKYITRMDYENVKGYWVRIWLDGKPKHKKMFSDNKHGGKLKAEKKAIQWRNKKLHELNLSKFLTIKNSVSHSTQKNNTSGVLGVHLGTNHKKNTEYYSWVASWWDYKQNKQAHKSYAVLTYGDRGAFLWACYYRFKMSGELKIINRADLPYRLPKDLTKLKEILPL